MAENVNKVSADCFDIKLPTLLTINGTPENILMVLEMKSSLSETIPAREQKLSEIMKC